MQVLCAMGALYKRKGGHTRLPAPQKCYLTPPGAAEPAPAAGSRVLPGGGAGSSPSRRSQARLIELNDSAPRRQPRVSGFSVPISIPSPFQLSEAHGAR